MLSFWSSQLQLIVQRLMAEARWPDDPWVQEQAQQLSALPVGKGMFSWWFLTPDGEAIKVDGEIEVGKTTRFADRINVMSALVWGSEKYPELREALPPREAGAINCRCQCNPDTAGRFICPACGGIGWLPKCGT
jgi:hypothetical protein